jgi:hypothetical protein
VVDVARRFYERSFFDPMEEIRILNNLSPRNFQYTPEIRDTVAQLCRIYLDSVSQQREQLRKSLTSEFVLFWFAHDMAVRAVRDNNASYIRDGLVAVVMEDARRDERDSLFPIALLHHSASKIGADANEIFEWAASIGSPRMELLLKEYATRPASLRDIAKFGFAEAQTPSGFDYVSRR